MNAFEKVEKDEKIEKERRKKHKHPGFYSKNKGKRGELLVAHIFNDAGFPARRGVQYRGGVGSPDVIVKGISKFFHLEIKYVERLNLNDAIIQAKEDSGDKIPMVIHKKARHGWLATLSLHTFIDILQVACDRAPANSLLKDICESIKKELKSNRKGHPYEVRETDIESDADLL